MQKLTDEQRTLVENSIPDLQFMLGSRYYRGLVRRLGRDDAFGVGCVAFCHAAFKYNADKGPFLRYAEWWLRHYLTRAVIKCGIMRDHGNRIGGRAGPRTVTRMGDADAESIAAEDSTDDAAEISDEAWQRMRDLEPKEHTILLLVANGCHYHEIADQLGWSRESIRLIHESAVNKVKYGQ